MSLSEKAGIVATHNRFVRDSDWSRVLAELAIEYDEGSELISAICQSSRGHMTTVYDAHAIALILSSIGLGEVTVIRIPLSGTIDFNSNQDSNQRVLNSLKPTFEAVFSGRQADADGTFAWKDGFVAGNRDINGPWTVPLEIGTTSAWTTWEHLTFHGGVARVPYSSHNLYLFLRLVDAPGISV